MRYAKDRNGRLIDASNAVPGRRYWCPNCGAPCHLRSGDRRVPYFAHNSGQAAEDCDLYHPGGYWLGEMPPNSSDYRSLYRSPSLYVLCSDIWPREREWRLFLLIPDVEAGTGSVKVPTGYRGSVTLPLSSLMRGGKRVQVRPQYTSYQINVQGQVDHVYVARVERSIAGLNRYGCSVFRYSPAGGRRLQDGQSLYWGREYVLVWPADYEPEWWPHLLGRRPMRPDGIWHCCIIRLPDERDQQTKAWVSQFLRREVKEPPVIMTLTSPVPASWLDDEALVVPAGSEVVVGLFGEPGANIPSVLEIAYPGQEAGQRVDLPRRLPVLVSLGRLMPGRTEVWLPEYPDVGLSLVAVPPGTASVELPSVILRFDNPSTGDFLEGPVFSSQVSDWLNEAANGHLRFNGVSLPERTAAFLRYRTHGDMVWKEVILSRSTEGEDEAFGEPHDQFKQRVSDAIRALLSRTGCVLQIDFGNFGSVTLDLMPKQKRTVAATSLRPELRDQIHWLLSLPHNGGPSASGDGVRLLRRRLEQILARFDAPDRDMLLTLVRRPVWPAAAEPHLRWLAQIISRS